MIKIGNAVVDENGKAAGGAIGDQTGKEIKIQSFYDSPWDVYIECSDRIMAEKAASFMEQICNDDNFGYDQGQRTTGYTAIVANGNKVSGAKGEFDCSSLVSACYIFAGLNISASNTTSTLRRALLAKGFKVFTYDSYVHTDKFATRGGIYLREGHHVAMALENGAFAYCLARGCTGDVVKTLKSNLNKIGYSLSVDGNFGEKTETAVKNFQANNSVPVTGIIDGFTAKAIASMIAKLEGPKKKTWQEIIAAISSNTTDWEKAINDAVKANNSIFKYLPALIEKIGNV